MQQSAGRPSAAAIDDQVAASARAPASAASGGRRGRRRGVASSSASGSGGRASASTSPARSARSFHSGSPSARQSTRDLPAGQRLARIPLALPVVEEPARREAVEQPLGELLGPGAFVGAVGRGGPLLGLHVVGGDERRLAADGQADVAGRRAPCRPASPRASICVPLLLGVGQGDPRRPGEAADGVGELEGRPRTARSRR